MAAHNPNALICEYIHHNTNIVNQLKSIGVTLSDNDIIVDLIINLYPSWVSIASLLSMSQTRKLTKVVSTCTAQENLKRRFGHR
ncbi:hypothetical protein FKP32DRAFT_1682162 [Trametes sanguinea]|nr:hypothetical protein FKP32DRAFT_1682162 [Trametes sanguinea]